MRSMCTQIMQYPKAMNHARIDLPKIVIQQARGLDKEQRLKHIDEELSYWKQRLLSAPVEQKNHIADRLIALRAEQTTIFK